MKKSTTKNIKYWLMYCRNKFTEFLEPKRGDQSSNYNENLRTLKVFERIKESIIQQRKYQIIRVYNYTLCTSDGRMYKVCVSSRDNFIFLNSFHFLVDSSHYP